MSESINAVKTRVIRVSEGQFMPQLSTDGMMWFDMRPSLTDRETAINQSVLMDLSTRGLPATGETVHSS